MREVLAGTGESEWERERLLEALDAYRRGLSEAPLLRKWCGGSSYDKLRTTLQQVQGERMAAGAPILQQVQDERMAAPGERRAAAGSSYDKLRTNGKEAAADERMAAAPVERDADGGAGAMTFVLSSEEVDRHGDVALVSGWRLAAYRRNPVFLWAHDYTRPVIGKAAAVWTEPRLLLARMEFAPTDFAAEVAALYRGGYQQGVSVGFKPLRYEERRQEQTGAFLGIRFLEQELLEVSAVPVPANRQALRRAMEQAPRVGDYLCRASGWAAGFADAESVAGWDLADPVMDPDGVVSPGLAAVLAEVRAGL